MLLLVIACERADSTDAPVAAAAVARRPSAVTTDPAHIAGTWDYRTESNCGSAGRGAVGFRWDAERSVYREDGSVTWPDTKLTIRWWGDSRFDATARTLSGSFDNTLGDKVTGTWLLEGDGPDRLVIEWNQTNGCHGQGIATRRR